MRNQLMVGLLSAGLIVAMLPGVTAAKGDAKWSECKRGGWADWAREDGSTFTDQAECVAYVAEGGTLVPPGPTFQSVCEGYGGEHRAAGYTGPAYTVAPACLWWEPTNETFYAATGPLTSPPLCPDWDGHGEYYPYPDWAPEASYVGC